MPPAPVAASLPWPHPQEAPPGLQHQARARGQRQGRSSGQQPRPCASAGKGGGRRGAAWRGVVWWCGMVWQAGGKGRRGETGVGAAGQRGEKGDSGWSGLKP